MFPFQLQHADTEAGSGSRWPPVEGMVNVGGEGPFQARGTKGWCVVLGAAVEHPRGGVGGGKEGRGERGGEGGSCVTRPHVTS